jgi:hypothetical protein
VGVGCRPCTGALDDDVHVVVPEDFVEQRLHLASTRSVEPWLPGRRRSQALSIALGCALDPRRRVVGPQDAKSVNRIHPGFTDRVRVVVAHPRMLSSGVHLVPSVPVGSTGNNDWRPTVAHCASCPLASTFCP